MPKKPALAIDSTKPLREIVFDLLSIPFLTLGLKYSIINLVIYIDFFKLKCYLTRF